MGNGLDEYISEFTANNITGPVLLTLDAAKLKVSYVHTSLACLFLKLDQSSSFTPT